MEKCWVAVDMDADMNVLKRLRKDGLEAQVEPRRMLVVQRMDSKVPGRYQHVYLHSRHLSSEKPERHI